MNQTQQSAAVPPPLAPTVGALYLREGRCRFCVWAPLAQKVEVRLLGSRERLVPLAQHPRGYYQGIVEGVEPGTLYFYRLDEARERPDPASCFQPQDVHGPSQVVNPHFIWDEG
jgi:maltooligosyltrehalose trehalohydrolase